MTDIVERLERKSDDPIRSEAAAEISRLRRTIAFFASVIKAGEPWTEACEREYDRARDLEREP
jgi:hypothetical protein